MQKIWNSKYQNNDYLYGLQPDTFLKENLSLIKKGGNVISLGEGEGRNALLLAKEGFETEALDLSDVGLKKLLKKSEEEELFITLRHTFFKYWKPLKEYDAVVSILFHLPKEEQKELFEKSFQALKKGGVFIGEFLSDKEINRENNLFCEGEEGYSLIEVYELLQSFTCKSLKISEEIVNLNAGARYQAEASLLRIVFQKI